jgi:hypothetical protein
VRPIATIVKGLAAREEGTMMHRLLIALGMAQICALIFAVPMSAIAQEATPAAGSTSMTDIRYVVPFTPDGLNPGLTASETLAGSCQFASSAILGRPDVWDCLGANDQLYDPCFENPFAAPDVAGEVACLASPFSTEVTVLTLADPLVRQKEDAPPSSNDPSVDAPETTAAASLEGWDLPWALELGNGERCTLLHGTLLALAGQTSYYGCEQGGLILGEVQRGQPLWTVSYLAPEALASSRVPVAVAWS